MYYFRVQYVIIARSAIYYTTLWDIVLCEARKDSTVYNNVILNLKHSTVQDNTVASDRMEQNRAQCSLM